MSQHASHKFFEVKNDGSKSVYKDENDSYFSGEILSESKLNQQWKKDLRFLQNIGSHENIEKFFMCCTFDDMSVRKLTELCDSSLKDYIESFNNNHKIIPLTLQCYFDTKNNSQKDLKDYFKPNSDDLPLCLDLLHQTAQGLKYLHDNDIIHRNIHPSNVFLTRTFQNKTVAKLGDFRHSRKEVKQRKTFQHSRKTLEWSNSTKSKRSSSAPPSFGRGWVAPTPIPHNRKLKFKPKDSQLEKKVKNLSLECEPARTYMASECYDKENIGSRESDIFAFGILTYYTLTKGGHPFKFSIRQKWDQDRVDETIASNIKGKIRARVNEQFLKANDKERKETQKAMIEQMVDHNPQNRLTINEVLYHPAFYTPQRKLEFLLKVRESVKIFWTKKDHPLKIKIDEVLEGYKKKINPKKIFWNYRYLTDPKLEVDKGWKPLYHAGGNIKTILEGLRDKVAHACDIQQEKGTPPEFIKDFEVTDDSFSHAKFVEIFVTTHFPKLLVDLYDSYHDYNKTKKREEHYAANFYPNY